MTQPSPGHSGIWDQARQPDRFAAAFAVLGDGIRRLHPAGRRRGMLFVGAPDRELREITGTFPAVLRSDHTTHPLFVLATDASLGHRVCPCSTKNWGNRRWIRAGCVLDFTAVTTDRASYLVESCSFLLPVNPDFSRRLRFLGLVPETCMETRCS